MPSLVEIHDPSCRPRDATRVQLLMRALLGLAMIGVPLGTCPPARGAERPAVGAGIESQIRLIDFGVVGGRIQATTTLTNRNARTRSFGLARQERLTLEIRGDVPTLDYVLAVPGDHFRIQCSGPEQLEIERETTRDSRTVRVHFVQQPEGELRLTITTGDAEQVVAARGLWHLLLEAPHACQTHLVPLLDVLRADWGLVETVRAAEEQLFAAAADEDRERVRQWNRLVAELASDDFATRRRADRELRAAGRGVLPFLAGLDPQSLDAEQRFRVRRMLAGLSNPDGHDTPERLTTDLYFDPHAWRALLSHQNAERREIAARRLAMLLGEEIDFDPRADLATRQRQIEALEIRLAPRS